MKLLSSLAALLCVAGPACADTFFVANQGVNTITQYDENGNASSFTSAFVNGPIGVALDRFGNLFVSTNSNTIEKFSPAGVDLGTFASVGVNFPMALAFDRSGNLYVANFAGNTVQKFTPDGAGTVFANVIRPTGLAFDAQGNLYVSNFGNTIERFSPTGTPLGTFASTGLNNPEGLAFDSLGRLYAANNGSDTIEVFSPTGVDLGAIPLTDASTLASELGDGAPLPGSGGHGKEVYIAYRTDGLAPCTTRSTALPRRSSTPSSSHSTTRARPTSPFTSARAPFR